MATTGVHSRRNLPRKVEQGKYQYGLGEVQMARVIYDFDVDGGAATTIIPKQTVWIPDNAVIIGTTINSTTALVSAASNITIGIGTATDSLLGSTNKTSFTLDAIIAGAPTLSAPVKVDGKAQVNFTTSGVLTAGVVEIVIYYLVAQA